MAGTNQAANLTGMLNQIGSKLGEERDISHFTRNIEDTFRPNYDTSTQEGMLAEGAYQAKMGRAPEAQAMAALAQQQRAKAKAEAEQATLAADQAQFSNLAGALSTARSELNAPTQGMVARGDSNRAQQLLDGFQQEYTPQPGASTEYKEAFKAGVSTLEKGVEAAGKADVDKTAAGVLQLKNRLSDPNDPLAKNELAAEQVRKHIKQIEQGRPEVVERMNAMTLQQADVESALRTQKKAQDAAAASRAVGAYAAGKLDHESATKALSAMAEAGNTEAAAELETINKIHKQRGEVSARDVTIDTAPTLISGYKSQIESLKGRGVDVGLYETKVKALESQAEPGMLKVNPTAFRQEARGLEVMLNQAMIAEDRRVRTEQDKETERQERARASIVNRSYSGPSMEGFVGDLQKKYGGELESPNFLGFGGDDPFHQLTEDDNGNIQWGSRLDDLDIMAMMRDRDRVLAGLESETYVLGEDNLPVFNPETKQFYLKGELTDRTSSTPSEKDIPQVKTMEEAMALPPGTEFIDPTGKRRVR